MDPARMRQWVLAFSVFALTLTAVGVLWVNFDRPADHPGWVLAGAIDRLDQQGVTFVEQARAFVVSTPGGLVALYARSPQLGEPVRFCGSSGWFEDAMHGSKFDRTGRYVLGPAPRGLDRFDVEIEGGEVYVDTTEVVIGPPRGRSDREPDGPFCTENG